MSSSLDDGLVRAIGVRGLTLNCINCTIGSTIFVLPALAAAELEASVIFLYLACALAFSLVALCLAELGSRTPISGGVYAYANKAFGSLVGYFTGILYLLGQMAASAAAAAILADTLASLNAWFSVPAVREALLVAVYGFFIVINILGVKSGIHTIEALTVAKLLPLALVLIAGVAGGRAANVTWGHVPSVATFGDSTLLILLALTGIEGGLTTGGEIKDPERTIPRGILLAGVGIVAFYCSVQLAAQSVLGSDLPTLTSAPLAVMVERALGSLASRVVVGTTVLCTTAYVAGDILGSPRVVYALGRDGTLPGWVARVHPRHQTPHRAIAAYSLLALALALTGSFKELALVSSVATVMYYLISCFAVLRLRRDPVPPGLRPFVVPGGATIPLLGASLMGIVLLTVKAEEWKMLGIVLGTAAGVYLIRTWMGGQTAVTRVSRVR